MICPHKIHTEKIEKHDNHTSKKGKMMKKLNSRLSSSCLAWALLLSSVLKVTSEVSEELTKPGTTSTPSGTTLTHTSCIAEHVNTAKHFWTAARGMPDGPNGRTLRKQQL
jgi:hypothetical protein